MLFRSGDSIVAIDGRPVREWQELIGRVSASAGRTVTLDVVRDGARRSIAVVPADTSIVSQITGRSERVGRIGVAPASRLAREELSFGESVVGGGVVVGP